MKRIVVGLGVLAAAAILLIVVNFVTSQHRTHYQIDPKHPLHKHYWLVSKSQRFHMRVTDSCNLCIMTKSHVTVWCSNATVVNQQCVATMTQGGELCVHQLGNHEEVWCSHYNTRANLQANVVGELDDNSGHFIVYAESHNKRRILWSSSNLIDLNQSLEKISGKRYGSSCYDKANIDVLLPLPVKPWLPTALMYKLLKILVKLECSNPGFNIHLRASLDTPQEDVQTLDVTGRTRVANTRNELIKRYLTEEHELVFWLDADVVSAPANLIQALYKTNPGGVVAPLIVIEGSNSEHNHLKQCGKPKCNEGIRGYQFYDVAAFFEDGATLQWPNRTIKGHDGFGSVSLFPPYFKSTEAVVPCESVGTVYLLPADVYKCPQARGSAVGGWVADDISAQNNTLAPARLNRCLGLTANDVTHFPTALTEHFPIVHAAKHLLGMPVVTNTDIVVAHANLPTYGESWHAGDPPNMWDDWIRPHILKQLDDPLWGLDERNPVPMARPRIKGLRELQQKQVWNKLFALGLPTKGDPEARLKRLEAALLGLGRKKS